jgi:flagellar hook assembly protein FlgD
VARLVDGQKDQGFVEVEWDATDNNGRRVASGLYFYRLTTETENITKRMMLVK